MSDQRTTPPIDSGSSDTTAYPSRRSVREAARREAEAQAQREEALRAEQAAAKREAEATARREANEAAQRKAQDKVQRDEQPTEKFSATDLPAVVAPAAAMPAVVAPDIAKPMTRREVREAEQRRQAELAQNKQSSSVLLEDPPAESTLATPSDSSTDQIAPISESVDTDKSTKSVDQEEKKSSTFMKVCIALFALVVVVGTIWGSYALEQGAPASNSDSASNSDAAASNPEFVIAPVTGDNGQTTWTITLTGLQEGSRVVLDGTEVRTHQNLFHRVIDSAKPKETVATEVTVVDKWPMDWVAHISFDGKSITQLSATTGT